MKHQKYPWPDLTYVEMLQPDYTPFTPPLFVYTHYVGYVDINESDGDYLYGVEFETDSKRRLNYVTGKYWHLLGRYLRKVDK